MGSSIEFLIGFCYATFLEWFLHRFVLHGLGKNKKSFFHFHWRHHQAVRKEGGYDSGYEAENWWTNEPRRREVLSLFALWILHFPLFFLFPGFVAGATVVMFGYYVIHKKSHVDVRWSWLWTYWHFTHHLGNQNKNFGVVTPVWDLIFNTYQLELIDRPEEEEEEI